MAEYTTAMIALYPPQGIGEWIGTIAPNIGERVSEDQLHMTLAVLGETSELESVKAAIVSIVAEYARTFASIPAQLNGVGRFYESDPNAVYVNVDSPFLGWFRAGLIDRLRLDGIQPLTDHGFTPHITVTYIKAGEDLPPDTKITPINVVFNKLCLTWGSEKMELELTGDLAIKTEDLESEVPSDETSIEAGLAVKSLDESGDTIGGYLVVFGDRNTKDLSKTTNADGSKGEYFTANTNFALEWPMPKPALYHHGLNAATKATLIGKITKISKDEIGLWAEAELNKHNQYYTTIKSMVSKGALNWSSGSLMHLRKKKSDGEITEWPIVEGSLTPTPAEPRHTNIMHIASSKSVEAAYKALNISADYLGIEDQEISLENAQDSVKANDDLASDQAVIKFSKSSSERVLKVDEKELLALLDKRIADKEAEKAAAIKAQTEQAELIKTEAVKLAEKLVAEKLADIEKSNAATKALPVPGNADPVTPKPRVSVGENRKYSSLSPEDMSYFVNMQTAYANVALKRQSGEQSPLEQQAIRFVTDMRNDTDRKLEREIAAKTIRAYNRKEISSEIVDGLPYKSIEDVEANDYDKSAVIAAIKANELDHTAQTAFGLEWIPTIWNSQLWMKVRQSNPYASTVQQFDMPSNPYKLPIEGTDPTAYLVTEATAVTELVYTAANTETLSKVGTGAPTITAKKIGVRVAWSNELLEDSTLIPIISNFRRQSERVLSDAIDYVIVNGDTDATASTNINAIDTTPAATDRFLASNGLRKYALVTNTGQTLSFGGGAPSMTLFRSLRRKLANQYAADLPNLVYVMGFETYMKCLDLPEFSTWQQLGVPGSAVTGMLPGGSPDQVGEAPRMVGVIDGIPVFVSAQLALAESTGKVDADTAGDNTLGQVTLHHKTRWALGYRRNVSIDVMQFGALSDTYQLWGMVRFGVTNFGDTQSAAVGVNILV